MRITQEADYALRMMCLLTERGATEAQPLGAPVMAEKVAIPPRFATKILRKLSLAGLVKSSRGVTGGYSLTADPARLTIRQVIEVIDGPIEISKCLSDDHACQNNPNKDCCRFHHVFGGLNDMLTQRLDRLTIGMMVDYSRTVKDLLDLIQ